MLAYLQPFDVYNSRVISSNISENQKIIQLSNGRIYTPPLNGQFANGKPKVARSHVISYDSRIVARVWSHVWSRLYLNFDIIFYYFFLLPHLSFFTFLFTATMHAQRKISARGLQAEYHKKKPDDRCWIGAFEWRLATDAVSAE